MLILHKNYLRNFILNRLHGHGRRVRLEPSEETTLVRLMENSTAIKMPPGLPQGYEDPEAGFSTGLQPVEN